MTVVKALWDRGRGRGRGQYARGDPIRPINHRGDFYQVAGPLNLPRCPQGRAVLVQAGSSDTGRRFTARHADAVFTAMSRTRRRRKFHADAGAAEGRMPDPLLILPGLNPMIASTETRGAASGTRGQ